MRSCSVNSAPDLKRQEISKPRHAVLNEREEHQRAGFAFLLNLSALCKDTATPHSSFLISHSAISCGLSCQRCDEYAAHALRGSAADPAVGGICERSAEQTVLPEIAREKQLAESAHAGKAAAGHVIAV